MVLKILVEDKLRWKEISSDLHRVQRDEKLIKFVGIGDKSLIFSTTRDHVSELLVEIVWLTKVYEGAHHRVKSEGIVKSSVLVPDCELHTVFEHI
jgi:hypothetical protein